MAVLPETRCLRFQRPLVYSKTRLRRLKLPRIVIVKSVCPAGDHLLSLASDLIAKH